MTPKVAKSLHSIKSTPPASLSTPLLAGKGVSNIAKNSKKGQSTVELILMLAMFVTIIFLVSAQFKSNELFAQIISGPWKALAGMIQNGSWKPPNESMGLHPNMHEPHRSVRGIPP